jgi:DNA-binding CsgD family transcriptional regulator/tetratricopeptide (TPR) repeat protein
MGDAIAWSYDLLSNDEQRMFRLLGAFVGTWTVDAAAAIYGQDEIGADGSEDSELASSRSEVLELISSLVDQSLVQRVAGTDGAPRFMMLEVIREFARAQLELLGETDKVLQRHATYYLEFAEASDQALIGPDQSSWLARLEAEQGNLRAALEWTAGQPDMSQGLRLAAALARFWMMHGHVKEGRGWLDRMLAQHGTSSVEIPLDLEARALSRAGWLAHYFDDNAATPLLEESLQLFRRLGDTRGVADVLASQGMMARAIGDYDSAISQLQQCVAIYRDLGDHEGIGRSLYRLAHLFREQGKYEEARLLGNECLSVFREIGDKSGEATAILILGDIARDLGETRLVHDYCSESLELFRALGELWGVGFSLYNLGMAALFERDFERASGLVRDSIKLFRELENDPSIAEALTGMGRISVQQGEIASAQNYFVEGLDIARRIGPRWLIATCLEGSSHIAASLGDGRRTVTLAGAASRLRDEIGVPIPPSARNELENTLQRARSTLNRKDFDEAWELGLHIPIDEAIVQSRSSPAIPSSSKVVDRLQSDFSLTDREQEVLRLLAAGLTDRQIGESLFISPRTVHRHVASLYEKLGAHTRTAAVAAGQRAGFLS